MPVACTLHLNVFETFQVISHEFIPHREHTSPPLDRMAAALKNA